MNRVPFTDLETGIYKYVWSMGTKPCQSDSIAWNDPFASHMNSTTWSYGASLGNVGPLSEGFYYMNVRAFNNVVRGGPLATTVCNTVPLVIDRSNPVVNSFLLSYDDEALLLYYRFNIT